MALEEEVLTNCWWMNVIVDDLWMNDHMIDESNALEGRKMRNFRHLDGTCLVVFFSRWDVGYDHTKSNIPLPVRSAQSKDLRLLEYSNR